MEYKRLTEKVYNAGYRKLPEDSVVLSKEEYDKLKSLYDTQKGAFMTSSIGDLPLTVEGLRKAVDEITRLNKVETELQELNIKYYNEAKDLRRELKQARKETAEKILNYLELSGIDTALFNTKIRPYIESMYGINASCNDKSRQKTAGCYHWEHIDEVEIKD